jgi:rare lipoprotein A
MNTTTHRAPLLAALATVAALALPAAAWAQTASAPAATKPAPAAAPAATAAPAPAAATASDGKIAWYGNRFAGRKTASGQVFNPAAMTMAHKTLPFGTRVKVTNTANQRSVVLRVNDRGPSTPDRVGDVSRAAALKLGMLRSGVVNATLEVVGGK